MYKTILIILLVIAVLAMLHFLAIWAENRGWIYYRKGYRRHGSAGAAARELQAVFHPSMEHTMEEHKEQETREERVESPSDY